MFTSLGCGHVRLSLVWLLTTKVKGNDVTTSDIYIDGVPHWRIVQELCESRDGRSGLSVLTNLLVSVDVKNY